MAFCEAQDCTPDFSQEDPFAGCNPSNERLLEIYNRKRGPDDPEMPCVQRGCPCWSLEEIEGLRYRDSEDISSDCWVDRDYGAYGNLDIWWILGPSYLSQVWTGKSDLGAVCSFRDFRKGEYDVVRFQYVTPEEFAVCETQVNQSGAARGFDCFSR